MISVPLAHVGGIPIEETLGALGPALLVGFGAASVRLRARLLRVRPEPARRSRARAGARKIRAGRSEEEH
jgi:hypothetical protein